MPSQTTENYLKALFFLQQEEGDLTITKLSNKLKVTLPTANSMIKKLQTNGWVTYQKYKPILFTESGQKMAAMIIRKHRLTEMYLTEKMGFGWEEVHEVAEQIEHIKSSKLFDRMDEILGHPTHDPHGSPIPDKEGNIHRNNYTRLSEKAPGSTVILRALKESSDDFLRYLNKHQLALGTKIKIIEREEFDGSMTILYNTDIQKSFSKEVCGRLLVDNLD